MQTTEISSDEKLTVLCERWHIRRLALFGSVLRDDFRPDSDIDVVVEFEPGARIGWEFVTLADELADLFGRDVDLNTPDMLSRYFRDRVLSSMKVLYERAGLSWRCTRSMNEGRS